MLRLDFEYLKGHDQHPERPSNHGPDKIRTSLLSLWHSCDVPALLGSLDEDCLTNVVLDLGTLNYTVVTGEVFGNYEAEAKS